MASVWGGDDPSVAWGQNSWQSNIAYVPQQSFIADATIIENIAFSINENEINIEKVKNSAKIANLDVFIENELQNKYETIIGENGIRLSGGQRQRLSIARALYTNLDLLILDEATSSLDSVAERKILESILNSKIKIESNEVLRIRTKAENYLKGR